MSSPPLLVPTGSEEEDSASAELLHNGFSHSVQNNHAEEEYDLPSLGEIVERNVSEEQGDEQHRPAEVANGRHKQNEQDDTRDGNHSVHELSAKEELLFWISSIRKIPRCSASSSLSNYKYVLPDLDQLVKDWPAEHKAAFREMPMKWPTDEADCSLEQHVDLCIALLRTPNERAQYQAMELLFGLYVELTKSLQHKCEGHDLLLRLMADLSRKFRKK